MNKSLMAALFLISTAATNANADDIMQSQPLTPVFTAPIFTWAGGYIGAQVGWSWEKANVRGKIKNLLEAPSVLLSPDPDGFLAGVYLGYNHQFSNYLVLGLETDFSLTKIDGKNKKDYIIKGVFDYSILAKTKKDWQGSTRVRLGYAAGRFMPYVAGGVAYSKIKTVVDLRSNSGTYLVAESTKTYDSPVIGWTAGAGMDYAVTDNILLRFEYRYVDFSHKEVIYKKRLNLSAEYNTNDIRLGVAYKF